MLEVARVLGAFSAVLLIGAVSVWAKLFGGPQLQRLNGISAPKMRNFETASRLLALAMALSAVSAILAVSGWVSS
jgi:hypothetical protein